MAARRQLLPAAIALAMAFAPAATAGPTGAVAIDTGHVGDERWMLVAYEGKNERCLDVLFRGNPCRGCGSAVPRGAAVEFRRHTYLQDQQSRPYDRKLTFVVVEASRRVERVKLNLAGRRAVTLELEDPFARKPVPRDLKRDFRFAIAHFKGDAHVRSAAGYDRQGKLVQRDLE